MSDKQFIMFCSPTLAGIKTASLFTTEYENKAELLSQLNRINILLKNKGVTALPLKYVRGRAVIYVFRASALKRDMQDEQVSRMLTKAGYSCVSTQGCVAELVKRMRNGKDFPHEIGLFLGYPPEDVKAFILHKGKDYVLNGYWKAYGNKERAQKLFDAYRSCTESFKKQYDYGKTLDQLTVRL